VTLEGRRLLITGVLTRRSIAYSVAEQAQEAGAEVLLTGFGRARRMTERAAARLPDPPDVLELDVNSQDDLTALAREVENRWGGLDGVLHAIAFAPEDAIGGNFLEAPPESVLQAFQTSAYSYAALGRHLAPLMPSGGSLVGLDFDASVAWPSYDWMGVSKAARMRWRAMHRLRRLPRTGQLRRRFLLCRVAPAERGQRDTEAL
jgi:meromycolic acid enoyl-[acyl-carrier-protein] reductase